MCTKGGDPTKGPGKAPLEERCEPPAGVYHVVSQLAGEDVVLLHGPFFSMILFTVGAAH
jgi:hypothetical protein